jgi:protein-S-isoprenylcysteine O-methyltransferase Ste14
VSGAAPKGGPIPPLFFLIAIAIQLALAAIPAAKFIAEPWHLSGIAFIVAGVAFAVWGNRQFSRAGTTVNPFEQASTLVTSGPFRVSRNPMYLGMVLVLLGAAILLRELLPFLVPFLFAWLIASRFIRHEEDRLHAQFGDAYDEYTQRVRRWL